MLPALAILAALCWGNDQDGAPGHARLPALAGHALAQPQAPQDIRVNAQLSTSRPYVNDPVELQITVEGTNAADRPSLRLPDGVEGEFVGGSDTSTSFTAVINGNVQKRETRSYVFQYRLTATREGTFTIPGGSVIVAGQSYPVPAVRFTAVRAEQSGDFSLRVEADKTELYAGEPARLRVMWGLGANVKAIRFSRMPGLDAFDVATPRDRVPTGQRQGDGSDRVETTMFGRQVVGTWSTEAIGGKPTRTLTVEQVITPGAPGRHELGPMSITFDAVVGERPRNFFDAPWDDRSVTRRVSVSSEPITITVKPLPEAGRPADFTGLVGAYTLTARADSESVGVGDPITLRVTVDGPDPVERVTLPALDTLPAFAPFKLSGEGWHLESGDTPGPRTFSTVIRVADPRVNEIPPIELACFDPQRGAYTRARSSPIPLRVRPTREVTAADAVGAPAAPLAPLAPLAPATTLESNRAGPVANAQGAWVLADEGASLSRAITSPAVAATLLAPPIAFFGAAAVGLLRRRAAREDAVTARSRRKALDALRSPSPTAATLAPPLRRYAAVVLGMAPEAVTPVDCAAQGLPHLAALGAVLAACDADRFGSTAEPLAPLAVAAAEAIEHAPRQSRPRRSGPALAAIAAACAAGAWLAPAPARAQAPGQPAPFDARAVFEEAGAQFRAAVDLAATNPAAAAAPAARAAAAYREIAARTGVRNHALEINAGNASMLAGDLGHAVAAFRRAARISPQDPSVRASLEAARARVGLRVEPDARARLADALLLWRTHLSRSTLLALALGAYLGAWGAAALRYFTGRPGPAPGLALAALTAALAVLMVADDYDTRASRDAVIVSPEVVGRSGPGEGLYEPSFKQPLRAGVECRVVEERGPWSLVRLIDGRETWVPTASLTRV